MATATEARRAVLLREDDNVAVATRAIPSGFALDLGSRTVVAREPIMPGHKVAVAAIAPGAAVRKYGQIIGFASKAIAPGEWVHVQNLTAGSVRLGIMPTPPSPRSAAAESSKPRTFPGYLRGDGRVGTRNYIVGDLAR